MKLKPIGQHTRPYQSSEATGQASPGVVYYSEAKANSGYAYVAPRTPIEQALASIWTQVLGLEHIGIRDHFQDLGGRSLHATQILSRLKSDLGLNFPRSLILEAPTIELMAACIETSYITS